MGRDNCRRAAFLDWQWQLGNFTGFFFVEEENAVAAKLKTCRPCGRYQREAKITEKKRSKVLPRWWPKERETKNGARGNQQQEKRKETNRRPRTKNWAKFHETRSVAAAAAAVGGGRGWQNGRVGGARRWRDRVVGVASHRRCVAAAGRRWFRGLRLGSVASRRPDAVGGARRFGRLRGRR